MFEKKIKAVKDFYILMEPDSLNCITKEGKIKESYSYNYDSNFSQKLVFDHLNDEIQIYETLEDAQTNKIIFEKKHKTKLEIIHIIENNATFYTLNLK